MHSSQRRYGVLSKEEGENVEVSVNLPRTGYLNLLSLMKNGHGQILYPNRLHKSPYLRESFLKLPTSEMKKRFIWQASLPVGEEIIWGVWSKDPLNLYLIFEQQGSTRLFEQLPMISLAALYERLKRANQSEICVTHTLYETYQK
jgi:hypothetical protein